MSTINIYVKRTNLHDVCGRIDYISNQKRQEEKLLAVEGNQNREFWKQLAAECQRATKNSKSEFDAEGNIVSEGKAIEAVELIIYLPNNILKMSEEEQRELLQSLRAELMQLTGCDCVLAMHDSHRDKENIEVDKKGNAHVHAILAERRLLPEHELKRAERNLFFNEEGKRVYKKAEIFENGELRPGCSIVKKGEVVNRFSSKNNNISKDFWLHNAKQSLAAWINEEMQPDKQRVVYDKEKSLTVPQMHKDKSFSDEVRMRIDDDNETIKIYNEDVLSGVFDEETAEKNRDRIRSSKNKAAEIRAIYAEIEKEEKQKLRELYKTAAMLWKEFRIAREKEEKELQEILFRRAREASIEIELKKKQLMELGIYSRMSEEEIEEFQQIEIEYGCVETNEGLIYVYDIDDYGYQYIDSRGRLDWMPSDEWIKEQGLLEEENSIRKEFIEKLAERGIDASTSDIDSLIADATGRKDFGKYKRQKEERMQRKTELVDISKYADIIGTGYKEEDDRQQ